MNNYDDEAMKREVEHCEKMQNQRKDNKKADKEKPQSGVN